jgi:hypothetical protein
MGTPFALEPATARDPTQVFDGRGRLEAGKIPEPGVDVEADVVRYSHLDG